MTLPPVRTVMVALLVVGSMVAGCAKSTSEQQSATSATTASVSSEDFEAQAADFVNLADMTAVRGFFIANQSGHLDEALAVANADEGGVYPVGTVIQLIPQEAMVKRRAGFDPGSNDWEFFELDISEDGTVIHNRGGAEIVNRFGSGSCSSCHAQADAKYDFVCEDTNGCEPLPIADEVITGLQQSDNRPRG